MKYFGPRSFTRGRAALIIVLSLTFLGLFSISRSSAQQPQEDPGPSVHAGYSPQRVRSENAQGPFDYAVFLERIANGEFPFDGGLVERDSPANSLVNNNGG